MRRMRFAVDGAGVIGGLVLLLVAAVAPAATADDAAAGPYAPLTGQWAGQVVGPSGSTSTTVWTINPDETFSMQTDQYTAVGSLQSLGAEFAFTYERNGQAYTAGMSQTYSTGRSRTIARSGWRGPEP
jgi:opacity protein-like surface antigen